MSKPYMRKDLEAIIENGGSVMHRGELIVSKDNLPSNADIKAAHEGKERVEYPRAGTPEKPTSTSPGDPPHLDEDGNQIDPTIAPEGTDSAAATNAAGAPASNAEIRTTKPV